MQPARHHHPRFNHPLRFLPPLRNLLSSRRITSTVISDILRHLSPPPLSLFLSSLLLPHLVVQTGSLRLYLRLVAFKQRPPGRKTRAWFNTWMLHIRASISCFPGASTLLDAPRNTLRKQTDTGLSSSIFRRALRAQRFFFSAPLVRRYCER